MGVVICTNSSTNRFTEHKSDWKTHTLIQRVKKRKWMHLYMKQSGFNLPRERKYW
jgi:hypothetical protein